MLGIFSTQYSPPVISAIKIPSTTLNMELETCLRQALEILDPKPTDRQAFVKSIAPLFSPDDYGIDEESLQQKVAEHEIALFSLAVFSLFQDFQHTCFDEYTNDDWDNITEKLRFPFDAAILAYLCGFRRLPLRGAVFQKVESLAWEYYKPKLSASIASVFPSEADLENLFVGAVSWYDEDWDAYRSPELRSFDAFDVFCHNHIRSRSHPANPAASK